MVDFIRDLWTDFANWVNLTLSLLVICIAITYFFRKIIKSIIEKTMAKLEARKDPPSREATEGKGGKDGKKDKEEKDQNG